MKGGIANLVAARGFDGRRPLVDDAFHAGAGLPPGLLARVTEHFLPTAHGLLGLVWVLIQSRAPLRRLGGISHSGQGPGEPMLRVVQAPWFVHKCVV